jgi:N-methylhydantoinase B
MASFDSIELAIYSGRLNAICDEMGYTLQRSALSPNIKDRLDFSCALFDGQGNICAQAAHIPVHLGSMAYAMSQVVDGFEWQEGDVVVFNDPFLGGTHLPDVTLVSPVFVEGELLAFVANRAHHANIGSSSAGSMPLSDNPEDEGVLIPPQKLYCAAEPNDPLIATLAAIEKQGSQALPGDFLAQLSANGIGVRRVLEWVAEVGREYFLLGLSALNDYGRKLTSETLLSLPQGEAIFEDSMDDDGFGEEYIPIRLRLTIDSGRVVADFSGSAPQVGGNINCPLSVTVASVYYVVVCLLPQYVPSCQGVFDCIRVTAPEGSFINARSGAAVAAGNVETSMRLVDVVIGALSELGVDVPAASQGSMNNVAIGSQVGPSPWDYYETIGGGAGASKGIDGLSARQVHMTNSLNTPVESLEMHYPLRIERYEIRKDSGGMGAAIGGDGLVRAYHFLSDATFTLLTERRIQGAWGSCGGNSGQKGINELNGTVLPGKCFEQVNAGDVLTIRTPGGGGYGLLEND